MLNPWIWLIGGLVICFAEMLLPGAFLLWVGLAAMATGLFLLALPNALGIEGLLLLFAALALIFSFAGRAVYGSMTKTTKPEFLGQRAQSLVGRSFLLETAIVNGEGTSRCRIRFGTCADRTWPQANASRSSRWKTASA